MSSLITTHTFPLEEKISISPSDSIHPITFKSTKILNLYIDSFKPLFDSFKTTIEEWISRIELNSNMYSLHIIEPSARIHGGVTIKYCEKILASFILDRSITRNPNGTKTINATIETKYIRQADEILDINQDQTFYINDRIFSPSQLINGRRLTLIETLENVLPTRSEAVVKALTHIFQIRPEDIAFDTFPKRYVIIYPCIANNWIKPPQPKRFYKYVSLQVFHNMLNTRTFRMNSIICQSDESESLYFGNFLCKEYENVIDRLRGSLKESN